MEKIFKSSFDVDHPLKRHFETFLLVPIYVYTDRCFQDFPDMSYDLDRFVWSVTPFGSDVSFYFPSLKNAENFCRKYVNNLSNRFWIDHLDPLYSLNSAISLL